MNPVVGDIPWLVPIGLGLLKVFPDWIGAISDGFKDLYEVLDTTPPV